VLATQYEQLAAGAVLGDDQKLRDHPEEIQRAVELARDNFRYLPVYSIQNVRISEEVCRKNQAILDIYSPKEIFYY
jgi:hypothetical protein